MSFLLDACRSIARKSSNPHATYRRLISLIPVSGEAVTNFFSSRRFFFVVSTGRTGSAWLARLLGSDPRAMVEHEPILWEQMAHLKAIEDPDEAESYIKDFRLKHMYLHWHNQSTVDIQLFGEVNSAVRRHLKPLRMHMPRVEFIHVVRDGRDFVRSVMGRSTYSGNHPVYRSFMPPVIDDYSARWTSLTEFEKTCWVWQWSNRYMREFVGSTVRFEDLLSSYDEFSGRMLKPLGITISESEWAKSVCRPANTTGKHVMGKWDTWTDHQRGMFVEICSAEMAECGYLLEAEA